MEKIGVGFEDLVYLTQTSRCTSNAEASSSHSRKKHAVAIPIDDHETPKHPPFMAEDMMRTL